MKKLNTTLLVSMIIHLELILSTSEVSRNTILGANDESNLNDRMSLIEAKNQQQEKEISFLKAARVEDKKDIRHLTRRVSRLESLLAAKNSVSSEKLLMRPKRPYRLLPVSQIENDQVNKDKATDPTFYGLATNCDELGNMGYTLNGYYLVKGNDKSNSIEAVFCRFKLPRESKTAPGISEERLGFVSTYARLENSKAVKEERFDLSTTVVTTKPKTSLTTSTIIPQTKSRPIPRFYSTTTTTRKKPDQYGVYIYTANTTHGLQKYKKIPPTETSGGSIYLINNHGKCLEQYMNQTYSRAGTKLIQRICNRYSVNDNGRSWSIKKADKYSGVRLHFGFGSCVSLGGFLRGPSKYAELFDDDDGGCDNQKWEVSVLENGIQFSSGNNCLAIEDDSTESGSFAISAVCDVKQKGQMWSFVLFE